MTLTLRLLQNFKALLYGDAPEGIPLASNGVKTHLNTLPWDPWPCICHTVLTRKLILEHALSSLVQCEVAGCATVLLKATKIDS